MVLISNELYWWQIGSFGTITRIINIVAKREDLLRVALAGPVAGFSLGFLLLLVGFILPPIDGLGIVVDASVFHESLLVGGLGSYQLQSLNWIFPYLLGHCWSIRPLCPIQIYIERIL